MKRIIGVGSALFAFVLAGSIGFAAGNLTDTPEVADLKYDPQTGNVVLDGTGTPSGKIISFVLVNPSGQLKPIADTARFPFPNVGVNTDNIATQIGQTDLSFEGVPTADLGPIFPTGLSAEGLFELLSRADYAYQPGGGGQFDLIVVPEPGSLALISLGLVGLVRTLRRRRK